MIDWTLSISNILAYIGFATVIAWRLAIRLTKFESTLEQHATKLEEHADLISHHNGKFEKAMEKVGDLAAEFQRLLGRTEALYEQRRRKEKDWPQ